MASLSRVAHPVIVDSPSMIVERRRMANYQKALDMFKSEYEKAAQDPRIRKPISFSLYNVWRYIDSIEKERG